VSARPVVWSPKPAEYVAAAWAGNTLLAYRIDEGEQLDVLAFDGPGKQRLLMADANLVAVSPDGTQVFLASQASVPGAVSVVNVADGAIAETLDLGSLSRGILWAAYGGSWSGDLVATPTNTGIAVFDVADGAISLRELLKDDPNTLANGIIEPQFSGDTDHIIARGGAAPGKNTAADDSTTALECDLATATCLARTPAPGSAWLHPAYNPSRPLKGDAS
jgi:DNA-binding beta-propeller fold protein YncE